MEAVGKENEELKTLLELAVDALEASRTEARGSAEALGMERKAAAALREALVSEKESSRLQHSSLRTDFGERATFLTSENFEVSYSLLSTAVETTDLRRDLLLTQRKLANAQDDIGELHTNYDILTRQLLVEQEGKAECEHEVMDLRAQLGAAGQVLLAATADLQDLQSCTLRLQASLSESRAECTALRAACAASDARAAQQEAAASVLRTQLAASAESNEELRRELRLAQADRDGRAREQDVSARDLRKELRECDETIGSLRAQVRMLESAAEGPAVRPVSGPPPPAPPRREKAPEPAPIEPPAAAVAPTAAKAKPEQKPKPPRAKNVPKELPSQAEPALQPAPAPQPAHEVAAAPSAAVDISAPYVPPAADSDSDELLPKRRHAPPPAKPQPPAPAVTLDGELANAPRIEAKTANAVSAESRPPPAAPSRAALVPLAQNVAPAKEAAAEPKKRKLGAVGAIDAMPPAFLLNMMGSFAAPKLVARK